MGYGQGELGPTTEKPTPVVKATCSPYWSTQLITTHFLGIWCKHPGKLSPPVSSLLAPQPCAETKLSRPLPLGCSLKTSMSHSS